MAEQQEKEYPPFINGKDIVNFTDGVEFDITAVRDRKNGDGFFVDIIADNGQPYTITANLVFTSMLLKKLTDEAFNKPSGSMAHLIMYPYKKNTKDGERVYLSLNKQKTGESNNKPAFNQSAQRTGGFSRR